MNIFGILTDQTCGEACWHARDEVCRCSCGGKNHGILRGPNGVQPKRMAKIAGCMYSLEGVGDYSELHPNGVEINRQAGYKSVDIPMLVINGIGHPHGNLGPSTLREIAERARQEGKQVWWSQYHYTWSLTDVEAPARIKYATDSQIDRWPELTAFREWKKERPPRYPALLWVRMKMPEKPSVLMVDKNTGLPLEDQLPPTRSMD